MIKKGDICMTTRDKTLWYDNCLVIHAGTIIQVDELREVWNGTHVIGKFDENKPSALFEFKDLEKLQNENNDN
jgi:hypothetical protein